MSADTRAGCVGDLKLVAKGKFGALYENEAAKLPSRRVIDVRSDTVTKPTQEMRLAMFEAEVGDDVYGDDPTVIALQEMTARTLGKEAALFVPTGTMGNLICAMIHCSGRGEEILLGDRSHMSLNEQGGVAQLGGIHPRTVRNLPDGTLDLEDVKGKICLSGDPHRAMTRLICVENTHNATGGKAVPVDYMDKLAAIIYGTGIKLHVDGARLFNAATALGVPASKLVEHADSVSLCLSKGLSAPIGSVIVGSKEFIARALRLRKALGGGMRQVGVVAAPGIIALEKMSQRLQVDHDNAKRMAIGLAALKDRGIEVDPSAVQTNMVIMELTNSCKLTAHDLVRGMASVRGEDDAEVRIIAATERRIRFVTHVQVSQEDVDLIVAKVARLLA